MPGRTLIATMGFDERHVLPALRLVPYDRLVVVAGRDAFRTPAFRRLRTVEPDLQAVRVDPFDLGGCLEAIEHSVHAALREGPVRIAAAGGTKILTMAAFLAAFHEGVEAWYGQDPPVRLPVLRGATLSAAFLPAETAVLARLHRETSVDVLLEALADSGLPRRTILAAIRSLEGKGLVRSMAQRGRATLRPAAGLALIRTHLAGDPEKG